MLTTDPVKTITPIDEITEDFRQHIFKNLKRNFPITPEDILKARNFAVEKGSTGSREHYEAREDYVDPDSKTELGAYGEMTLKRFYKFHNIEHTDPDFNTFGVEGKSFKKEDLKMLGTEVQCKTQYESMAKYLERFCEQRNLPGGEGYLFSKGSMYGNKKGHRDPILDNKKSLAILGMVQIKTKGSYPNEIPYEGEVRGLVLVRNLHIHELFKEPIKETLIKSKTSIYYKDVENLGYGVLWCLNPNRFV